MATVSVKSVAQSELKLKKVVLSPKGLQQYNLYRSAYNESHGVEISDEDLIGLLIEYALSKDAVFQKSIKPKRNDSRSSAA